MEGMGKRVKDIERKSEMKEREERKRNMIINGIGVKEGKRREAVQEVLGVLGVEIKVEEMRRIRGEVGKEMVLVRCK